MKKERKRKEKKERSKIRTRTKDRRKEFTKTANTRMGIKGSKTDTKGPINHSIDRCIRLPLKHWIHFRRSSLCPPTSNILSGSERVSSAQEKQNKCLPLVEKLGTTVSLGFMVPGNSSQLNMHLNVS